MDQNEQPFLCAFFFGTTGLAPVLIITHFPFFRIQQDHEVFPVLDDSVVDFIKG